MDQEAVLLAAIHTNPADETAWLALADHLEEQGDARAELLRLTCGLRREPDGPRRLTWEERVRELLASGLRPCRPVLTNSIGMHLALIPAGTFRMGSPDSEAKREPHEGPVHEVILSRPFYLAVFPVTQTQYEVVMGTNPSRFRGAAGGGPDHPVESVSWDEAAGIRSRSARRSSRWYAVCSTAGRCRPRSWAHHSISTSCQPEAPDDPT